MKINKEKERKNMALQKAITLDNGITLNYHRIASLNKITNSANIIEVISFSHRVRRFPMKIAYFCQGSQSWPS